MQLFVQQEYTMATRAWAKLAGESVLCMSGHARRVPEARVHPAVYHSQPALSRGHQTRPHSSEQKFSKLLCSLSFTPTLQSGLHAHSHG